MDLVEEADQDKNEKIDFGEWQHMVKRIKARIPMAEDHLVEVRSALIYLGNQFLTSLRFAHRSSNYSKCTTRMQTTASP
jgi:hypothetical protein